MMRRSAIRNVCSLALGFALVALMARATVAQWSSGANLPTNVIRAVGVFFPGNGKFYAMGGRTSDVAGSDLTHPAEYDPTGNTWTTKTATYPDSQVNNMACGVLTIGGSRIVCVGGSAAGQSTATSRVFVYDPVGDAITTLTAPDNWPGNPGGTILPGGFAVVNNKLYILGGFNINVASTNQIWEFDPSLAVGSRWTQKVNTPEGVIYAPTTAINGIIYVAGASDFSGGIVIDTTNSFSFNPSANNIGGIAAIPRATGETRAINFGGRMWVLGGGRVAPNPSNEVDVYNPGTNSWATGLPFTTARRNFAADSDGTRVWLAGGYASDGVTALNTTERFTPPTASSSTISGVITSADGSALAGVTMRLSGTQTRLTITDSNGNYRFDDVETGGFYTLTPSRANFVFTPVDRSFSQLGNHTDAAFTGSFTGDNANPDDTTEYFVRQHYLDFLGREPDQGGFEYWSGQINVCNGDADCIRSRRIGVSAAFFASAEFQQTGSYIYELYAGALGRAPGYEEFMPDRSKVVGGPDLDASKVKFTDAFVQRSEFTAKYSQGLTSDQFVDALLQTMSARSGADLSSLRNTMLSDYDKGGRSLVVSDAVQATEFAQAEYNKAFVLMEYFGYLRRNPDTNGYNFWLDVLNGREAGNYRGMVCAFITSTEYQRRFSTLITHNNSECGH